MATWNIRGLNRLPKQREVQDVVLSNHLSVCAILESHVAIDRLNGVCSAVFPHWNWTSNHNVCDHGTRIILGWDPSVIQLMVIMAKEQLWNDLLMHKGFVGSHPWIIMGDFNASLNSTDSTTSTSTIPIATREFRDCVEEINMEDVNFTGLHFTWNQRPHASDGILKKIDRVMANDSFIEEFTDAYVSTVKDGWGKEVEGRMMFRVVKKLRMLKKPIRKLMWQKGNIHKLVQKVRKELDEAQTELDKYPDSSEHRERESAKLREFNSLLLEEERFLKQKAKIEWLRVGDSNSAYFHKVVKGRQNRSHISAVFDSNNCLMEGADVPHVFVQHYEEFLGKAGTSQEIIRPVTNEEIKNAIFNIGNDKAPGPDGYSSTFFKNAWDVVGDDVCSGVKQFFSNGQLLTELNHTIIALLPKVQSPSKSAFISGRRIADNILLTQELMHNYHLNRGVPRCAFKVDIQKAYDTVDWEFLREILAHFGFHKVMIKWIMRCISSTSFSIAINGTLYGYFKGKRGLRQGDPMSPYLFTLVMEVLSLMLQRNAQQVDGFRFHPRCDNLNLINVCFADDLFLFSHADITSVKVIFDALDEFKECSGLTPSIPKSTGFFANVSSNVKNQILDLMPFEEGTLPVRYLGVPLISSRLLSSDCKPLIEMVKNRIQDWKNKFLSFTGRVQLISSVLVSMQIYWYSVFIVPDNVIKDIEKMMRGFLWCQGDMKRGKAKVKWDDVCHPKNEGGLGIKRLKGWNVALMASHVWRILSNKQSLWVRWIHSYRIMDQNFWEVAIAPDASWSWRKILQIRDIIGNHFIHVIQNGRNTSAWTDIWASHSRLKDMLSRREIVRAGFSGREKVCDLYQNGSWVWPSAWVEVIPSLATVSHPNPQTGNDVVKWRMIDGKVAEFSVNVVWHTIRPHADQVLWVNLVWFSQCVQRHSFMVWLLMGERLKTQDKLKIWERKKGAQIVGMPNWGLDWKAIFQPKPKTEDEVSEQVLKDALKNNNDGETVDLNNQCVEDGSKVVSKKGRVSHKLNFDNNNKSQWQSTEAKGIKQNAVKNNHGIKDNIAMEETNWNVESQKNNHGIKDNIAMEETNWNVESQKNRNQNVLRKRDKGKGIDGEGNNKTYSKDRIETNNPFYVLVDDEGNGD
ncbi:uncharacterized protein [Rutidosis leptorrhynchoides]|uniref:uncharacterized protein n=1 Tax=Rutidosis leptorrhynchoides TaxID=125765 RepID=UPI003A9A3062